MFAPRTDDLMVLMRPRLDGRLESATLPQAPTAADNDEDQHEVEGGGGIEFGECLS